MSSRKTKKKKVQGAGPIVPKAWLQKFLSLNPFVWQDIANTAPPRDLIHVFCYASNVQAEVQAAFVMISPRQRRQARSPSTSRNERNENLPRPLSLQPQMPAEAPTIRKLPESVALRLRSTLVVTSLSDAVFQLVQNSLDADARNIRVQANLARNSCVVEDDGVGILPVDMGMVGQMYGQSPVARGGKKKKKLAADLVQPHPSILAPVRQASGSAARL